MGWTLNGAKGVAVIWAFEEKESAKAAARSQMQEHRDEASEKWNTLSPEEQQEMIKAAQANAGARRSEAKTRWNEIPPEQKQEAVEQRKNTFTSRFQN